MNESIDALMREVAAARRSHWMNQVERHAHQIPDAVALRWQGRSITWAEFAMDVRRAARALRASGVRYGDRVAILALNRPEFLSAVIGANRLGAIVVPVNARLRASEIAFILDDAEVAALVLDTPLAPLGRAALDAAAVTPEILLLEGDEPWGTAPEGETEPVVDVPETEPALIVYTSGTTGRPKGAMLSHLNLQAAGLTSAFSGKASPDDVRLLSVPLFHVAGLGALQILAMYGSCLVLQPLGSFDVTTTLDLIERERVTGMFLVPSQWQAVCDDPSLASRDLSSLTRLAWGAAPATPALLRAMAAEFPGADIIAAFGQTEMSPTTCTLRAEDAVRKLGSVGTPIPSLSVRIVDGLGRDVPRGEVGEIVYRGPTQMLGYWRRPEETAAAFAGGWFHSGDLVRQDDEGFIYVVDRLKDMIISGGENIYCAEVEGVLADHPDVAEIAVIGRPDDRWGEVPVAVLVTRSGAGLDVTSLRAWAEPRLASYKLPRVVEQVAELPRNAAGKVVKAELRSRFGG